MAEDMFPVKSEFLLYQSKDGKTKLQTRICNESVWLSLKELSELFDIDKSGISRHLKNIFESGELSRDAVVAFFAITASDGKIYNVEHFNLDAIISVGYRVNSIIGTHFRQWATQRLREYIVKGFTLDDERLKQAGGGSYFDELLARIRDIRSSEKVFWRKVLDIYFTGHGSQPMYMKDWIVKLDEFIKFSGKEILQHAGKITHEDALKKARLEYEKWHKEQLEQSSEVEKHFVEAMKELKQLEQKVPGRLID